MAPREVTVDQKPYDLAPVDPDAKIPQSVRDAAARAAAIHQQAYQTEPQPEPVVVAAEPVAAAVAPVVAAVPEPRPVAAVPVQPEPPAATDDAKDTNWEHKFYAMQGRHKKATTQIGEMQEQMAQLGDELVRTQALVHNAPRIGDGVQPAPQPVRNSQITDADVQNYGPEIIDLVRRAAAEAAAGEVEPLRQDTSQIKQTLQKTAKQRVADSLTDAVPTWQQINRDPEFKRWLSLPDVYSGVVKGRLLNEAVKAADAPRAIAFFTSFLSERAATGHSDPVVDTQPQAAALREPAIPLETLAAPGRARPATGSTSPGSPADKPVFTRAQVAAFYANVRKGHYVGREREKDADEQLIFAAQREGRVR